MGVEDVGRKARRPKREGQREDNKEETIKANRDRTEMAVVG